MVDAMLREAVGVFQDERSLRSAVDMLLISGFDRSCVSLLAGQHTIESKLEHRFKTVADLEDDPAAPKRAYVDADSRTEAEAAMVGGLFYVGAVAVAGMVVASGGTVAAALIGGAMAGGGGGLIGAALAQFLEHRHANQLQAELDRGGLLLWVRTPAPEDERRAVGILRAHGADNVHVHDLPAEHSEDTGGVSYDMRFMKPLGM